jgi:phage protein U
VAELNRQQPDSAPEERQRSVNYAASGHPAVEQLMAEQGTGPITDVAVLHGEFWPEEESIEDFLEAFHEWRGHKRTEPGA